MQFDQKSIPKCPNCGAKRYFEFQLNNTILNYFNDLLDLDWGVVAVYSCSKSCKSESAYVEEHIEIQVSPDEIEKEKMKNKAEKMLKEFENDIAEAEANGDLEDFLKENVQI